MCEIMMDTQDVLTPPVPHLGLTSAFTCMPLNCMYANVQHGIQRDCMYANVQHGIQRDCMYANVQHGIQSDSLLNSDMHHTDDYMVV